MWYKRKTLNLSKKMWLVSMSEALILLFEFYYLNFFKIVWRLLFCLACMSVDYMHALCPWGSIESIRLLWTRIANGCEVPSECPEKNFGSSGRAASTLKHWPISSVPFSLFLFLFFPSLFSPLFPQSPIDQARIEITGHWWIGLISCKIEKSILT